MSCFSNNCEGSVAPDPHRRVCYSNGLVLGVDEFVQEEIYFLEQHREHNRGLHGYGTVCGLLVEIQDSASEGPRIWVGPGTAVDPKGRVVRVPQAQCAQIDEWLRRFGNTLGSPPDLLSSPDLTRLYLKLCYRECKTENVPIPGGPCRSADESSVPSRVADDFTLELSTTPPDQTEADVVREFGALLRSIDFSTLQPATITLDEWAALVRSLAANGSPSSPALVIPVGSPPGFFIHPEDADAFIRLAFRIWVTEVRPGLLPNGANCAGGPPKECCILLAEIAFPVREEAGQLIVDGGAAVVQLAQDRRPYLIHTQLLQELWSGGATFQQILGGGVPSSPDGPIDHGSLTGLANDDHLQYLLVRDRGGSPPPAVDFLLREISGDDTHHVTGLPFARPGFHDALPAGQPAGTAPFGALGDLTGTYPNPSIANLQGNAVDALFPNEGEVLMFSGGKWVPAPLPPPPPAPLPPILEKSLVRVQAISWKHHSRLGSPKEIEFPFKPQGGNDIIVRGFVFVFGREKAGDDAVQVRSGSLDAETFQVYFEFPHADVPNTVESVRVLPDLGRIIPVKPFDFNNPAAGVEEIAGQEAPAALFIVPEKTLELVGRAFRIVIELRGDHILDREKRAIDAEFVRSSLPSGDRPQQVQVGIQGGTFRSWLRISNSIDDFLLPRFREATVENLVALLPAITPDIAKRIVTFRDANPGLDSFDKLRGTNGGVAGVGDAMIKAIAQAFRL